MKKSLIALSVTALFFASCKKETTPAALTPTDLTGTAHIKGNTTKNAIIPNAGGWNTNGRIPAAGVNVTIRVQKGGAVGTALYPNTTGASTPLGADVYTGVTDA